MKESNIENGKRKESVQDVLSSKKRLSSMPKPTCRRTNSVLIKLFEQIYQSGRPNFRGCRVPLPGNQLNIPLWRNLLEDYPDNIICDFLEFGFPLDFNKSVKLNTNERRNHKGARQHPEFVSEYLHREVTRSRIAGPFQSNPFSIHIESSRGILKIGFALSK